MSEENLQNEKSDLTLQVTEDRLKLVPLETFYTLSDSPKSSMDFVAHFMVDENGEYFVDQSEALQILFKGRTFGDIEELSTQVRDAIDETAVPKK